LFSLVSFWVVAVTAEALSPSLSPELVVGAMPAAGSALPALLVTKASLAVVASSS
jgi:hypothetical protein